MQGPTITPSKLCHPASPVIPHSYRIPRHPVLRSPLTSRAHELWLDEKVYTQELMSAFPRPGFAWGFTVKFEKLLSCENVTVVIQCLFTITRLHQLRFPCSFQVLLSSTMNHATCVDYCVPEDILIS
jgi:hypothetical protein